MRGGGGGGEVNGVCVGYVGCVGGRVGEGEAGAEARGLARARVRVQAQAGAQAGAEARAKARAKARAEEEAIVQLESEQMVEALEAAEAADAMLASLPCSSDAEREDAEIAYLESKLGLGGKKVKKKSKVRAGAPPRRGSSHDACV